MRPAGVLLFALVLAGILACGKGEQELRDDCPTAGTACPACTSDSDCTIVSNPCHETATCTHARREPVLTVNQIGCNSEYDRPPAERCGCVSSVCRTR